MPAFVFRTTFSKGGFLFALRRAACAVFGNKDDPAIGADDFSFGISHHSFGAAIPADDLAREVHREHGKIHRTLDDRAEKFFGIDR